MIDIYGKISPQLPDDIPLNARKVILFDPAELYARIKIDRFKRRQSLSMGEMFPSLPGNVCTCGCGTPLTGRQTRWADEDHSNFLLTIYRVIKGDISYIKLLMSYYLPYECAICQKKPYVIEKTLAAGIQVDHIIGIEDGGGGCWLGNYQFLCHRCNNIKSANDKKIRSKPKPLPLSNIYK